MVAPDARGHARGLRSRRHMRLADCADDMAALIDELDTGPVIAVGYSMGGPIAQLLWKRHPEKVAGLVLCATGPELGFGVRALNDAYLASVAGMARATGRLAAVPAAGANVLRRVRAHRPANFLEWAADEMRRHDVRMLTEAARASAASTPARGSTTSTSRPRCCGPTATAWWTRRARPSSRPRSAARASSTTTTATSPAPSTFTEPLVGACRDVAWRASA